MEIHAHVPHPGKSAVHWVLEGVFIVLSVLLAFGVGQCREARQDRELAGKMLHGIQAEMEHNLAILEPIEPLHERWAAALETVDTSRDKDKSGFDFFLKLRPELPPGSVSAWAVLRRSSWDAALQGGALRLLDYDLMASLTDTYGLQSRSDGTLAALRVTLYAPSAFEPPNRAATVKATWIGVEDIVSEEVELLKNYKQNLPALKAAAAKQ